MNKIKKLTVINNTIKNKKSNDKNSEENSEEDNSEDSEEFMIIENKEKSKSSFVITLFSNKILQEKLIYLYIDSNSIYSFENRDNLNKFSNLETLILLGFKFPNDFSFELKNLKNLELYECFNLTISQNCGLRLTKLKLYSRITICKVKALISFPELEEFYFDSKIDINENKIKNFMDFKSLKKLRVFTGNKYDFFEIGNAPLERLDIYNSNKPDKKLIEKIISINSLKNLKL